MASASSSASNDGLKGWKLHVSEGRQWWEYIGGSYQQNKVERYHLNTYDSKDFVRLPPARTPVEAARNGIKFYSQTQTEDGHWAHDYGGMHFSS